MTTVFWTARGQADLRFTPSSKQILHISLPSWFGACFTQSIGCRIFRSRDEPCRSIQILPFER